MRNSPQTATKFARVDARNARECWFSLQGIIHLRWAFACLPACVSQQSGVSAAGLRGPRATGAAAAARARREGSCWFCCYQRAKAQGRERPTWGVQPAASTNSQFCTSPRRERQRTHEQITQTHTPWPPTEPPSLDSPLRLRERYFFCILAYPMSGFCNLDEKCLASEIPDDKQHLVLMHLGNIGANKTRCQNK